MNRFFFERVVLALLATTTIANAATAAAAIPDESLDYSVNWPSGLSLGEAHWKAHNSGTTQAPSWDFSFDADVHVPGFGLTDSYHSKTSGNFCTDTLIKDQQHGSRKSGETVTVDAKTLTATRTAATPDGVSTLTVPDCVHDALAFLFFTRRELVNGRVPAPQTILLGGKYEVKLTSLGSAKIQSGSKTYDTDRYGGHVQGAAANLNLDFYFARDAVRTPVLVRIPLAMGAFSLELEH